MPTNHAINYIEFPASNLTATKAFFNEVFGWAFVDYGPDYCAFSGQGVDGGFYQADSRARRDEGSVLVVLYSDNLEASQWAVEQAGGEILVPVFSFPGGRRFHFVEPSGNELAIWSES